MTQTVAADTAAKEADLRRPALPGARIDLLYGLLSLGSTTIWGVMSAWLLYFYLPPPSSTGGGGGALVPATLYGGAMLALRYPVPGSTCSTDCCPWGARRSGAS